MKKLFFLFSTLVLIAAIPSTEKQINGLKSFAKAFGYVKYFHPSSEAVNLDWNAFAEYGASEILKCDNNEEVIKTLNELFKPIGSSISFSSSKKKYDLNQIIPKDRSAYEESYWQHLGVSTGMNSPSAQNGVYKSVLVNQYIEKDESDDFGNLALSIDAEKYHGKEIKYKAWVKLKEGSTGQAQLWMRVDNEDGSRGFFENMDSNPIKNPEWGEFEIIGNVNEDASKFLIGCFLSGEGTLFLDKVELSYKDNGEWIPIPLKNSGFEEANIGEISENSDWFGNSKGYNYSLSESESVEGKQGAVISFEGDSYLEKGEAIFDSRPAFGDIIEKKIGKEIYCQIPLCLYSKKTGTFPPSENITELTNKLEECKGDASDLSVRLGNTITTYNVFQHFYPYFDVVDVNWEAEFEKALTRSFTDQNMQDHVITLQKLTATLKDGHIRCSAGYKEQMSLPISWEWIENKLIITHVLDENLDLSVGDQITEINGQSSEDYFAEIHSTISAGTDGWLKHKARYQSLQDEEGTEITLKINGKELTLKFDREYDYTATKIKIQNSKYKLLDNNIYYLNIGSIPMDTITSLLPKLQEAEGIICDLRGYPKGNHDLISHLLPAQDTTTGWMKNPMITRPDFENVDFEDYGWEMPTKEPHLGDKNVVFITDGRAISYAESYMGFIEGYDLATIVGQPTAGTNGNVNSFELPGGIRITWTGMKVVKHDGSQQHAIGILPDIYVDKTIEGVKAGKDEFLDKAIEVIMEK